MSQKENPQVSAKETAIILELLRETLPLDGDVVELGCYRGDTSVLLARELQQAEKQTQKTQNPQEKRLFLYDSFAGLPEKTAADRSAAGDQFRKGELTVTKREVIEKFKKRGLRVPRIKKAFFSDLDPVADLPEKISFAFLDGDLYQSIRDSLALVQDKMVKDSIIIVHDYNNPELPGVARAVDEFIFRHPRPFAKRETLAILRF